MYVINILMNKCSMEECLGTETLRLEFCYKITHILFICNISFRCSLWYPQTLSLCCSVHFCTNVVCSNLDEEINRKYKKQMSANVNL